MSAVVPPLSLPAKLQTVATEAREQCAALQDTLDGWIAVGGKLNDLACWWIAEAKQDGGKPTQRLRKRKSGVKAPEGLRKRCIAFLESLVSSTGFDGKEINRALSLYALEQSAPWVGQLKSERKARELRSLATWHWEGCKLTRDGERSIKAVKAALEDGGMASLSSREIREIVSAILGRVSKPKNLARQAAVAFFQAIEGTDTQPAADRADVLSWLAVLLAESPLAAQVITEAVEAHLDTLTASEGKVAAA